MKPAGRTSRVARVVVAGLLASVFLVARSRAGDGIIGSSTFRPDVVGRAGVVAAGRHFAAYAGMRMLGRGGNAIDAGVAATFAAAVTEISHFGLGGEVPILVYRASLGEVRVISGQGTAPAAASVDGFRRARGIPTNGPSAGTVPAVVDALCIALAEFGTLSLGDVLAPAIELADGFPWYEFLSLYLRPELERMATFPTGARVYLPDGAVPAVGSLFRQPDLARTLRMLAAAEQPGASRGRAAGIYAARDRFYRGDIGQRIARAVQNAGGLLSERDLSAYRGRIETPTRGQFKTRQGTFEVFKTGFWGQGPVLLQALAMLDGNDLERLGHNSTAYIHAVTEALKLALADRDQFYGDPDFASVPVLGLLSPGYAAERRLLIDPFAATVPRPGDPWKWQPAPEKATRGTTVPTPTPIDPSLPPPLDTTTVAVADASGNLFSASPSSGWFSGGVFIAGDTGIPLGNRMQAFVLDPNHPNVVQAGKRPRTTLSPTLVFRDGQPFLALTSPGGDTQDQQALQVLLNIAVFHMSPQEAIEAPRFNTYHYRESFRDHRMHVGALQLENRIPAEVAEALGRLGHRIGIVGPFMMDTGTVVAGFDGRHATVFGAADVRRQRFVAGW